MRLLLVILVLIVGKGVILSDAAAQTAVWRGRVYTPATFPKAASCSCGMCQALRAQWSAATAIRSTIMPLRVSPLARSPAAVGYRLETRTRQVPYRVRICHGSHCTYETRYRSESYQVRVQVESQTAGEVAYRGTRPAVARAIMDFVQPNSRDVVYDLGCGEGELLAAASPYGCQLVGIEIDQQRANMAARKLPHANIVYGDIRHQTYRDGTIFLAYLYPDLIAEVVPLLPSGALLVSLAHEVPGVELFEHLIEVDGQEHRIYLGVLP